jgi:acyl-CoA hydrolase
MSGPRECTPAEAAALLRPVDTLGLGIGPSHPSALLRALGERDDFERLTVFAGLLTELYALFARQGVRMVSGFFGPAERAYVAAGHCVEYVPADFRRFAPIEHKLAPRVVACAAALPDANGRVSLSLHAGATVHDLQRAARDPARVLIVEVSPAFPRTRGLAPEHPHSLALDQIDVLVHSDREPPILPEPEPDPVEHAIAAYVREFIPDGATLQTGIGGIPSAVAGLLASGPGGDYGIHSEMFTHGLMLLQRAGKVTNRKGCHDGVSVTTFALGSRELYDWLDEREDVVFLPVDRVNDPGVIGSNRSMRSLNGALSVDLFGQVAADAIGPRQYSGIGGHEDFTAGASMALGGRSLVCLPSTAQVKGQAISRIRAALPEGSLVTTPRHQTDIVVTEHGVAELFGRTVTERAHALIAIAHPDQRAALRADWERLHGR